MSDPPLARIAVFLYGHPDMTIELLQGDILSRPCDMLVVNLFQEDVKRPRGVKRPGRVTRPGGATGAVDKALDGAITRLMAERKFEGKLGEWLAFPTFGRIKARNVVVMGLGKRDAFGPDAVRKVGAHIVRAAREQRAGTVVTILHGAGIGRVTRDNRVGRDGMNPKAAAQALAEGVLLASYRFKAYKGAQAKKDKEAREPRRVTIAELSAATVRQAIEGIERGRVLADATNLARDLVNTPSSDMPPARLAEEAKKLAVRGSGISCKVFDRDAMERMGMAAALAVARGSAHPPVGVHLVYRPRASKKTVAVVGKAVTFDSGGLSLKTSEHMATMKIDMAGAASVVGLFKALAVLQPNVTVHGIFLAVENMPSGSAYRPGDVVRASDGTTIEVLNTDAEGRVTLADALCYARRQKPDIIVDLATLTGACVTALGEDIAGLLSPNDGLAEKLLNAAKETGEPLWRLPLYEPYAKLIKSKIADIKNTGGGSGGGAITAALFLKTFVEGVPWAHIDIAGPSYTEKEIQPDQTVGASGYGVRLLARFLQSIGK